MIGWKDWGILIKLQPLGERNMLAIFFTQEHGRYGGVCRRLDSNPLSLGMVAELHWQATLEENLGYWTVEEAILSCIVHTPFGLAFFQFMRLLVLAIWPDRVPEAAVFHHLVQSLNLVQNAESLIQYEGFETHLIQALGYGRPLPELEESSEPEWIQRVQRLHARQAFFIRTWPQLYSLHTARQNFLNQLEGHSQKPRGAYFNPRQRSQV